MGHDTPSESQQVPNASNHIQSTANRPPVALQGLLDNDEGSSAVSSESGVYGQAEIISAGGWTQSTLNGITTAPTNWRTPASALTNKLAFSLDLSSVHQAREHELQEGHTELDLKTPTGQNSFQSAHEDSDWKVAASLHQTNQVLLQLPAERQNSIRQKVKAVGTMMDSAEPDVVHRVASWSSEGSLSLKALSDAVSDKLLHVPTADLGAIAGNTGLGEARAETAQTTLATYICVYCSIFRGTFYDVELHEAMCAKRTDGSDQTSTGGETLSSALLVERSPSPSSITSLSEKELPSLALLSAIEAEAFETDNYPEMCKLLDRVNRRLLDSPRRRRKQLQFDLSQKQQLMDDLISRKMSGSRPSSRRGSPCATARPSPPPTRLPANKGLSSSRDTSEQAVGAQTARHKGERYRRGLKTEITTLSEPQILVPECAADDTLELPVSGQSASPSHGHGEEWRNRLAGLSHEATGRTRGNSPTMGSVQATSAQSGDGAVESAKSLDSLVFSAEQLEARARMRAGAKSPNRASSPHLFRGTEAAPVDAAAKTKSCLGPLMPSEAQLQARADGRAAVVWKEIAYAYAARDLLESYLKESNTEQEGVATAQQLWQQERFDSQAKVASSSMEVLQEINFERQSKFQAAEFDRRAALLEGVHGEFDLDGSGKVGEAELLELGKARRRLGHMQDGEWTIENNKELIRCIGADAQGNISEERFVTFFLGTLRSEDSAQFDNTMKQFMQCAKACRETAAKQKAAEQQSEIQTLRSKLAELEDGVQHVEVSNMSPLLLPSLDAEFGLVNERLVRATVNSAMNEAMKRAETDSAAAEVDPEVKTATVMKAATDAAIMLKQRLRDSSPILSRGAGPTVSQQTASQSVVELKSEVEVEPQVEVESEVEVRPHVKAASVVKAATDAALHAALEKAAENSVSTAQQRFRKSLELSLSRMEEAEARAQTPRGDHTTLEETTTKTAAEQETAKKAGEKEAELTQVNGSLVGSNADGVYVCEYCAAAFQGTYEEVLEHEASCLAKLAEAEAAKMTAIKKAAEQDAARKAAVAELIDQPTRMEELIEVAKQAAIKKAVEQEVAAAELVEQPMRLEDLVDLPEDLVDLPEDLASQQAPTSPTIPKEDDFWLLQERRLAMEQEEEQLLLQQRQKQEEEQLRMQHHQKQEEQSPMTDEEAVMIFELFDADGDGTVDIDELVLFLKAIKQSDDVTRAQVEEVWDKNQNGTVSAL